jgi:hypothetical protein
VKSVWIGASAVIVLASTSILLSQSGPTFDPALNIARGRPYTLSPRPSYSLTNDAGDDRQLTDGVVSNWNPIWTQTSTVGWTNASPITIVIDLQSVQPIAGASFRTAAGKAGVSWPRSIFVLTSDDGLTYYPAGDLVALTPGSGPPAAGYAIFRYATNVFRTHGRYVAIIVDGIRPYTFCDEIEVLAGDRSWLTTPLSGESTTDLQAYFVAAHTVTAIRQRLANDLDAARSALASSSADAAARSDLTYRLNAIEAEIGAVHDVPASFKAVLPINDLESRIFQVQGAIASANGLPALTAWPADPWAFVRPTDKPQALGPDSVNIVAMNGETRSGVFSVSNSTEQAMTVSVRIMEQDGTTPPDVTPFQVAWTDTRELVPVADALLPLDDSGRSFGLPAGMTGQVWLRFSPSNRAASSYAGTIDIQADDRPPTHVPFLLTVLPGQFPARPSLHLGGFDYTDADRMQGLGVTPNNRDALIRELRGMLVDSPWARAQVMPFGQYDAAGKLIGNLDTSAFDQWVARWPSASRYSVFLNVSDAIGNVPSTDARFGTAVAQWISFWTARAASRGIDPRQLMLLLVDEPNSAAQDKRVTTWARAIKAAAPAVGIWEDPLYPDPAAAQPTLLDVTDTLALERGLIVQQGAPFVDFYRSRSARGQSLDVYGTSGPVRLMDPYTYHRLQAWVATDLGAASSFFWSFSDDAGGHSWNEYSTTTPLYSPFFLSDSAVAPSKHSEAIREGVEDVEYLAMLRKRLADVLSVDPGRAGLADAAGLGDRARAAVLQSAGATDFQWASAKDRSVADRMRLQIADALNGATLCFGNSLSTPPAPPAPIVPVVSPPAVACPCSVWGPTAAPSRIETGDTNAVEVGMRFQPAANGAITGIRFYKDAANTGPHFGHLWTVDGRLLGTVVFANESASGWQEARFATPVPVAANATYVVSYYTPTGSYAADEDYFTGLVSQDMLRPLAAETDGGNGVYLYGAAGFPAETYHATNYWVDVIFTNR